MTNSYHHAPSSKAGNNILLQQFYSLHYPSRSPFTRGTTSTVMSKNRPPSQKGPERSCFKMTMVFPVRARLTTESQHPEPADRFLSISRTWHESWMLCRSFARMLLASTEDDAPTPRLVFTGGYKQTNNAFSRALPSVHTFLPPYGLGTCCCGRLRSNQISPP